MKKTTIITVLVTLLSVITFGSCAKPATEIYWYCTAGLKTPAEEIVKKYNDAGGKVVLITGGIGQLLPQIETTKKGDLLSPMGDKAYKLIKKKNMTLDAVPLIRHDAVFALNPKATGIKTFDDLWQKKVRIAIGNPKTTALGESWKDALNKMDKPAREGFDNNRTIEPVNILQIVNYLKTDSIDAGLIFDTVAHANNLTTISFPENLAFHENAYLMILKTSADKSEAKKFMKFVTENRAVFTKHGYKPLK